MNLIPIVLLLSGIEMSSFRNFICFPFYLDVAQSACILTKGEKNTNLSYDISRTHSNRKTLLNLRRVRENTCGMRVHGFLLVSGLDIPCRVSSPVNQLTWDINQFFETLDKKRNNASSLNQRSTTLTISFYVVYKQFSMSSSSPSCTWSAQLNDVHVVHSSSSK